MLGIRYDASVTVRLRLRGVARRLAIPASPRLDEGKGAGCSAAGQTSCHFWLRGAPICDATAKRRTIAPTTVALTIREAGMLSTIPSYGRLRLNSPHRLALASALEERFPTGSNTPSPSSGYGSAAPRQPFSTLSPLAGRGLGEGLLFLRCDLTENRSRGHLHELSQAAMVEGGDRRDILFVPIDGDVALVRHQAGQDPRVDRARIM